MKHLMTLAALFASLLALAQNDPFWNPDANGDDVIGVTDLMSLLTVYNSSLALSDTVYCDYNGGTFGEFWFDVFNESIVVDSILIQWEYAGTEPTYVPFCPDPIEEPYAFSVERTLVSNPFYLTEGWIGPQTFYSEIFSNSGDVSLELYAFSMGQPDYQFGSSLVYGGVNGYSTISYPEWFAENSFDADFWVFDEQGMYSTSYNNSDNQFFRLIPYWHYAE